MPYPDTKRIAYVMKRYPRYSETFIVNEIVAHEAAGMDIEIFSLRAPEDTHFQDVIARVRAPVNYLPAATPKTPLFWRNLVETAELLPGIWQVLPSVRRELIRDIHQALSLARLICQKDIAHVHAHFASQATTVTRLAAKFAGINYSFTAHAKDIFHQSVDAEDMRLKLREALFSITVSDFNLNYLRDTFGRDAEHVVRLYNGLDLDRFPYRSPQQRPRQIIAIGRLVEKKGFADLITACAILAERGKEFSCDIIGTGEQEAALREQIQQQGLQTLVHVLGPLPQQDIIQHIQQAAVLAAPCVIAADGNRDGLPTVLLESMALGTPVVSTDVTGIPELVKHERTGLVTPQYDPESLANALEHLLDTPEVRTNLAIQARQLIESQFDIQQNAAQLRKRFQTSVLPAAMSQEAS